LVFEAVPPAPPATMSTTNEGLEFIEEFVEEALSSLEGVPAQLTQFREHPEEPAPIHAVFRAVHSIKGAAGFLGLVAVKEFSHHLENTLDGVRKEEIPLTDELAHVLIEGVDTLDEMIRLAGEGNVVQTLSEPQQEMLARIISAAQGDSVAPVESKDLAGQFAWIYEAMAKDSESSFRDWERRIRDALERHLTATEHDEPDNELKSPREGLDIAGLLEMNFEGKSEDFTSLARESLAPLGVAAADIVQREALTACRSALRNLADWAATRELAELRDACEKAATDLDKLSSSPLDVDGSLLEIIWKPLAEILGRYEKKDESPANAPANGEGGRAEGGGEGSGSSRARFVRVREDRLDFFMEQVSGLFITGELLKDLHARMSKSDVGNTLVEELKHLSREFNKQSRLLQQAVVSLRRVAVGTLLSKYPKMARSLAAQLNKKIEVHLTGEDVEAEKTLVEDLDAPLTHMIRNVVDHGIESPADRLARDVPEIGNLWISAEQSRTHLTISIRDDGRGIDPHRVRQKAISKGILTEAAAAALTDEQAVNLIFQPGFSTAEQISEISGRGVGLDVVRSNIESHGGEVFVESRAGIGTTFTLRIPLKEAVLVIDGLMVRQAGQDFVLPFEFVRQIEELAAEDLASARGQEIATLRGEVYHGVSLSSILGIANSEMRSPRKSILAASRDGAVCLFVDEIMGHRQVVTSSLPATANWNDNVMGVAQLGGGRLALVLSVEAMVRNLRKAAPAWH
jgi:two-component system chemotaxis sensor kinase CheA